MSRERETNSATKNPDATSSETLSDIEQNEKTSNATATTNSPSPDGQFDNSSGDSPQDNPDPM